MASANAAAGDERSDGAEAGALGSPEEFCCGAALGTCGTVIVAVPGSDCAARTRTPCLARDPDALRQRLRVCDFHASYDPLEVLVRDGCVTKLRFQERSRASSPEVLSCILRELGDLRFDCVDGQACELLYLDTLATL